MARFIGTPGESAGARGALYVLVPFLLVFFFILLPFVYGLIFIWHQGLIAFLLSISAVVLVFRIQRRDYAEIWRTVREGRNFIQGARGEVLVHQALKELPEDYIVFHDFHPLDASGKPARWNVDHIVVGPTGVFVLDAKYYGRPLVQAAARNSFSRKNVKQAQRNAMELKEHLVRWSAGELEKLFVVPMVVYAQPDARLECLREGYVRTIPLRLLVREVTSQTARVMDREKAGRVARVLYSQIGRDLQYSFKSEFDAYGELAKAARYAARDARRTASAVASTVATEAIAAAGGPGATSDGLLSVAQGPPTVCPRCGGALIRRVARHGERTGKPFLACENYYKTGCGYGWNLDE